MRFNRITFVAGLACGYVAGTAAGRERYEQIVKFARSAAEHPAVKQAAGTIQSQATGLASNAAQKVGGQLHDRVPQLAHSAVHSVGDRMPGKKHRDANGNGHRNAAGNGGKGAGNGRPFSATSNSHLRPTDK
jgi:hypothetical protein